MEPETLDHLLELSRSLDAYRTAVQKAHDHFTFEVEQLWRDQAALRDEVHTAVTTLSNRIENVTRGLTTDPAEVAAKIVTDANRGLIGG